MPFWRSMGVGAGVFFTGGFCFGDSSSYPDHFRGLRILTTREGTSQSFCGVEDAFSPFTFPGLWPVSPRAKSVGILVMQGTSERGRVPPLCCGGASGASGGVGASVRRALLERARARVIRGA